MATAISAEQTSRRCADTVERISATRFGTSGTSRYRQSERWKLRSTTPSATRKIRVTSANSTIANRSQSGTTAPRARTIQKTASNTATSIDGSGYHPAGSLPG